MTLVRCLAVCCVLAVMQQAQAESPILPGPVVPKALQAYTDTQEIRSALELFVDRLKGARLKRDTGSYSNGYYVDAVYPKNNWPSVAGKDVERSPCEEDKWAMAVHRGWAWMATGYNVVGRLIEKRGVGGGNRNIDLHIARHGRSTLLRVVDIAKIAAFVDGSLRNANIPIAVRKDLVAFLKVLVEFKSHHDLLISRSDSIRDWMKRPFSLSITPGEVGRDLVARINSLLTLRDPQVSKCLEGYIAHILILPEGHQFRSGAIYSGGIAIYAVGFWWRREGEGTSGLAEALIRYAIRRLENG